MLFPYSILLKYHLLNVFCPEHSTETTEPIYFSTAFSHMVYDTQFTAQLLHYKQTLIGGKGVSIPA